MIDWIAVAILPDAFPAPMTMTRPLNPTTSLPIRTQRPFALRAFLMAVSGSADLMACSRRCSAMLRANLFRTEQLLKSS